LFNKRAQFTNKNCAFSFGIGPLYGIKVIKLV
jgi:hypothetical protein